LPTGKVLQTRWKTGAGHRSNVLAARPDLIKAGKAELASEMQNNARYFGGLTGF